MPRSAPTVINRWSSQEREGQHPWRIIIALLLALLLHLIAFILLKEFNVFQEVRTAELDTETIRVEQVILEELPEVRPQGSETIPDLSKDQEEIPELDDVLAELKNQDLDIRADIAEPELSIKMTTPVKVGDLDGILDEVTLSSASLDALEQSSIDVIDNTLAAEGQMVIDEGALTESLLDNADIITDSLDLASKGFQQEGIMEGYNSLDDLMSMSTLNLQGARTALPSDMLFDTNSAKLKSVARFGLMKLMMLIDKNPTMYCILEGHTDTFGDEVYNQTLSVERAQAIKSYLVKYIDNAEQIVVRGYGESQPLIAEGSENEQAVNRRVDILMRKTLELPKKKKQASKNPEPKAPPASIRRPPVKVLVREPILVKPVLTPSPLRAIPIND